MPFSDAANLLAEANTWRLDLFEFYAVYSTGVGDLGLTWSVPARAKGCKIEKVSGT